jgi:pyruvate kinase
MVAAEREFATELAAVHPANKDSARNLVHYLALRRADRRPLQADLQAFGLSSLGSLEAHVLPTLDAVSTALAALLGKATGPPVRAAFEQGSHLLQRNAAAVLGASPPSHRARIIVTSPPEAATDRAVLAGLHSGGMNILRINTAHDGAVNWKNMVAHLRAAERTNGTPPRPDGKPPTLLQFDLAGPKLRTGSIMPEPPKARWEVHDTCSIILFADGADFPRDAPAIGLHVPLAAGANGKTAGAAAVLTAACAGDLLRLVDDRGRTRTLRITDSGPGWVSAACDQRGILAPGIELELRRIIGAHAAKEDESSSKEHKKGGRAAKKEKRSSDDTDDEEDSATSHRHRKSALVATASVGELPSQPGALMLHTGDTLTMRLGDFPGTAPSEPGGDFEISVELPQVFQALQVGHRVFMDDGKFEGVVIDTNSKDFARVRLTLVRGGAAKLASEKGINLPDSQLVLPALTDDDRADLKDVLKLGADLIALSFTQTPQDVIDLHAALDAAGPAGKDVGVLMKVETAVGFINLPKLLLAAMQRPKYSVMVARGDLAVEVGFARLSEVQEEMLWICEAAHAPVVWATQVLDTMARTGAPTRSEVTDAAAASRAEAVMLNKGPFMDSVLALLRDVLQRLNAHERKKMHLLRKLSVAGSGESDGP